MGWREDVKRLPALAPVDFEVDPGRTCLIIVDMQYVDAHREYGLGASLKQNQPDVWDYYFRRVENEVIPNSKRLLEEFRRRGLRVIHLTLGSVLPDGSDMIALRRPKKNSALASLLHHVGTFEHKILEGFTPLEGELVMNKTSRSAFNSTGIERVLLNMELETLVFCGVTTSTCVDTTARDAADRGFKCVIVEDATAELDEASHEATLRQFAMRWGRVWTTEEALVAVTIGNQIRS
jgi:nicotinamidase-related amidase